MPLSLGARVTLDAERPVAGGRMLARHDGQVVLVAGAIPGERITARVTRVARGTVYADTVEVVTASPDRRARRGRPLRRVDPRPHRLPAAGRAQGRHHRGRVAADRAPAGSCAVACHGVPRARLSLTRPAARVRRPPRLLPRGHASALRPGGRPGSWASPRGVGAGGRGRAVSRRGPRAGGRGPGRERARHRARLPSARPRPARRPACSSRWLQG